MITHELGHHVQNLLGLNERASSDRRSGANSASVALELQADCFAGVWGHEASQPGRAVGKVESIRVTSKRGCAPRRQSATTGCRRCPPAASCRNDSPTARRRSASSGSSGEWTPAIRARAARRCRRRGSGHDRQNRRATRRRAEAERVSSGLCDLARFLLFVTPSAAAAAGDGGADTLRGGPLAQDVLAGALARLLTWRCTRSICSAALRFRRPGRSGKISNRSSGFGGLAMTISVSTVA